MRLLLINPDNPVVGSTKVARGNRLNRFRIWKPLGLLTLARLTPREWEIEVVDENNGPYDYEAAPRPDLVGITAFTSPWGFALDAITVPVHIWQGGRDDTVPVAMAKHLAEVIPGAVMRMFPDEGHHLLYSYWPQILAALAEV